MVEVLKSGSTAKTVVCWNCSALLKYRKDDVYYQFVNTVEDEYIFCPECGEKIYTK